MGTNVLQHSSLKIHSSYDVPGRRGGCLPRGGGGMVGGGIPACTEADTPLPPSPPVDRHTLVKTLPWPNFVAAGKKQLKNSNINKVEQKFADNTEFI